MIGGIDPFSRLACDTFGTSRRPRASFSMAESDCTPSPLAQARGSPVDVLVSKNSGDISLGCPSSTSANDIETTAFR